MNPGNVGPTFDEWKAGVEAALAASGRKGRQVLPDRLDAGWKSGTPPVVFVRDLQPADFAPLTQQAQAARLPLMVRQARTDLGVLKLLRAVLLPSGAVIMALGLIGLVWSLLLVLMSVGRGVSARTAQPWRASEDLLGQVRQLRSDVDAVSVQAKGTAAVWSDASVTNTAESLRKTLTDARLILLGLPGNFGLTDAPWTAQADQLEQQVRVLEGRLDAAGASSQLANSAEVNLLSIFAWGSFGFALACLVPICLGGVVMAVAVWCGITLRQLSS